MGKLYPEIDDRLRQFIEAQHLFFVATAPSGAEGHVNLSPKGLGGFRVLGPRRLAYLDHVGSGAETIAHLRENGRIVVMFCAFEGPPRILRLHGRGRVIEPQDLEFTALRAHFVDAARARALISIELERIGDSCGYGVPLYTYHGERTQLDDWAQRKGVDALTRYQREHNAHSIDGLPALRWVETES
jgi:hypothetical protein